MCIFFVLLQVDRRMRQQSIQMQHVLCFVEILTRTGLCNPEKRVDCGAEDLGCHDNCLDVCCFLAKDGLSAKAELTMNPNPLAFKKNKQI